VQLNGIPHNWQGWAALVRQALAIEEPIPPEELLLVRDQYGQSLRPFSPAADVTPRVGAVLALLYRDGNDLRLPLTVRSTHMNSHGGEVSLPGGSADPGDFDDIATALRECQEELGIDTQSITIWGRLKSIYIMPSNFQITPVVGFRDSLPALTVSTLEVSSVITTTLRELLDPATIVVEPRNLRGLDVLVPFFAIMEQKVWGATALILSDLTARMRRVLANNTR
jgi:8-oxo-dGTP pyrophosphatase MutT (NUDIX family)